MKKPAAIDPMEKRVIDALTFAGIPFTTETDEQNKGLDFYLPDYGIHIEVKQFHSERIADQMSRAPNIVALQGALAVSLFCALVKREFYT